MALSARIAESEGLPVPHCREEFGDLGAADIIANLIQQSTLTASPRMRLRKLALTRLSRSNTLPLDWLAASVSLAGTIEGPIALTANMTASRDVQDDFLQTLVKDKTTVNVFLVNGIRLSGQLAAFDALTVLLASGAVAQLVFKHAISTVLPVNGMAQAREPVEAPLRGDKLNLLRGRVR